MEIKPGSSTYFKESGQQSARMDGGAVPSFCVEGILALLNFERDLSRRLGELVKFDNELL
jgi:hypothetical protein